MNKFRLFVLFCLIISFTYAQFINEYGVKGAGTRTWNSDRGNYDINFSTAIFLSTNFTQHCMLNPEIVYSVRGYSKKKYIHYPHFNVADGREHIQFHYLSIPLFFKNQVSRGKVRPFIKVGPRLDYLFQASEKKFKTHYLSYGYSSAVGLKIWGEGKTNISIEFRYNGDFKPMKGYKYSDFRNFSYEICVGIGKQTH